MIDAFLNTANETTRRLARLPGQILRAPTAALHTMALNADPHPNEYGINFHGETTRFFRESLVKAYGDLPDNIRDFLAETEIRIDIGGTQSDIHPEENHVFSPTSPDDPRIHQNQVSAYYSPYRHQIAIAQHEYTHMEDFPYFERRPRFANMDPVQKRKEKERLLIKQADVFKRNNPEIVSGKMDFKGIVDNKWRILHIDETQKALRHEIGHALYKEAHVKYDDSYKKAYEADLGALGGTEEARKKGWGYFVQTKPSDLGRNEVFAATFSALTGHEQDDDILITFSNAAKWVEGFRSDFDNYLRNNVILTLDDEMDSEDEPPLDDAAPTNNDHEKPNIGQKIGNAAKARVEKTKQRLVSILGSGP